MNPARSLHVLLPALGSAGDVHPVLAIALGLQARGHRATVLTNPWFEQQVRAAGVEFMPLGTLQQAEIAVKDPRLWHPTRAFGAVVDYLIRPNIEPLYRIIADHCRAGTVVAASGPCFGARIAHDRLGVPLATVHLQPALFRSLIDGGTLNRLPMGPRVPALLKRALYGAVDALLVDRVLAPPVNEFRRRLDLPPVRGILRDYVHSPQRVIGMFPPWFAAPQPDWPPQARLAGFALYDAGEHYPMPPSAEDFLTAGPAPVVFTPGSGAATLHGFFHASVEACRRTGLRAMLVTNFPDQLPRDLPSHVAAFGYLPFGRLLPRCAALVYPGGIGTLAQCIRAGIPHLVVPHAHDQFDNAARVKRLGLGEVIAAGRYDSRRAARALQHLLGSAALQLRCREQAGAVDSAAAVQRACELIEGCAAGGTS